MRRLGWFGILWFQLGGPALAAQEPTSAKAAVPLALDCSALPNLTQRLVAPDRRTTLVAKCRARSVDDEVIQLTVLRAGAPVDSVVLDLGPDWHPRELLWAPDAKALVVNGAETSYSGFQFISVSLSARLPTLELRQQLGRDMIGHLAPCQASHPPTICAEFLARPNPNLTAVAWDHGSTALVIVAEVPPSSSYDAILGMTIGYVVDARTGTIRKRLTATELKRQWQSAIGFPIQTNP